MNHAFTWCFDIETCHFVHNFPYFETIGVTCSSHGDLHIWDDIFFVLFHFRAAFTMGEKVGVTFPSSWGRSSIRE